MQNQSGETIWNGDSIQIGLDPDFEKSWEGNDLFGLNGHRVFEYGVAWSGKAEEKPMTWRWISYLDNLPVGQPEPRIDLKVTREGTLTLYEVMFPWEVLGMSAAPQPGTAIGIALSVADKDTGKTGKRALCLFSGIISGKDAQQFGPVWLR